MTHAAVLLIAHGSRQAPANEDLLHVQQSLRELDEFKIIEACFLELAEPDIDTGAARCLEQGADLVLLVPYFLSAGVHVRRDLVEAVQRLASRHPEACFRLAEPLGRHPLLPSIVAERARQARDRT